jgi:hypothetical protein
MEIKTALYRIFYDFPFRWMRFGWTPWEMTKNYWMGKTFKPEISENHR